MCVPFVGVVVEDGSTLPTDGSLLMAAVEPSGGIRNSPAGALTDRRPVFFVGGSVTDDYYDEGTSQTVNLPTGWVLMGVAV